MRRRARLAALALAAAALLAGCGGDGDGEEAAGDEPAATEPAATAEAPGATPTGIALAAAETTAVGTYRSTFVLEYESPQGPVRITGEGEFQSEPPRGRMDMEVEQAAGAGEIEGREVIYDGSVLYVSAPEEFEGGARWVALDLGDEETALSRMGGLDRADPVQALAYLRGAGDDAEEIGRETVRDAETTRYRLEIDLERAAEQAPERRDVIERAREATGIDAVPAEVWVDDEGLVRRVRLVYENVPLADGTTTAVTVTTELYDFGADVAIEPPPENEVLRTQDGPGGAGSSR